MEYSLRMFQYPRTKIKKKTPEKANIYPDWKQLPGEGQYWLKILGDKITPEKYMYHYRLNSLCYYCYPVSHSRVVHPGSTEGVSIYRNIILRLYFSHHSTPPIAWCSDHEVALYIPTSSTWKISKNTRPKTRKLKKLFPWSWIKFTIYENLQSFKDTEWNWTIEKRYQKEVLCQHGRGRFWNVPCLGAFNSRLSSSSIWHCLWTMPMTKAKTYLYLFP